MSHYYEPRLGQFTVNMIDKDFVEDCPAKKVTVGVWARTTQTTHTTGFIPNFRLDVIGNKTYSNNGNSAKQVPFAKQIEGLPEQNQQPPQLGDMQ